MNATDMVQGNLALKLEAPATPAFTVVKGGRSHFQAVARRPIWFPNTAWQARPQPVRRHDFGPRCPKGFDDCRPGRCAHALLCTCHLDLQRSSRRVCRVGIQRYLRDRPCSVWRFLVVASPGASD